MKENTPYWGTIDGWHQPGIYELYAKMISKFDNAVFVEHGTWVGRSAICMAERIKASGKKIEFYAIDFFEDCYLTLDGKKVGEQYFENIEPFKDIINTIVGSTHEVYTQFEDESIDFLFMDADHEYEALKKDIGLWYPKIKKGGIISGHDYDPDQWDGVCIAVDEIFPDAEITMASGGNIWLKHKL